jgi:DNA-binding NtrC family response regulator
MRNAYSGREEAFERGERASTTQNVGAFGARDPLASRPRSSPNVVGVSQRMLDVYQVIDRVADTDCTVLITGESGTGKELLARRLHEVSQRASGPFVTVSCGAIPEALLESELFGCVKGAFTGAHATKLGRFAEAGGGTLLLDEVSELSLTLQVKLLRVLQSQEYSPVGDTCTVRTDVRIVATTSVDLDRAVAAGRFREDLYSRLNIIHLDLPSLRDRPEDIPVLAEHFLERTNERLGRNVSVSRAAMRLLTDSTWPGNVRELENTIERAAILCQNSAIEPNDLPAGVHHASVNRTFTPELPDAGLKLRAVVEAFENELIRQALDRTGWNKNQAARLLGLNRTTLVEMLKRKRIGTRAA